VTIPLLLYSTGFKIGTNTNSDGLINCLPPTQDNFAASTKIYARNFRSIYKILWHLDCFVTRDSIFGLAGRRSGALFFARNLDCFIVTRNCTSVYRDLLPFNSFTVTTGFSSIYRDWQRTGKSLAATTATAYTVAKHMLFCLHRLCSQDN